MYQSSSFHPDSMSPSSPSRRQRCIYRHDRKSVRTLLAAARICTAAKIPDRTEPLDRFHLVPAETNSDGGGLVVARGNPGHIRLQLADVMLVHSPFPRSRGRCFVLAAARSSSPQRPRGRPRLCPLGDAAMETSSGARQEQRRQRMEKKWESCGGKGWRRGATVEGTAMDLWPWWIRDIARG
jgi:hypothetical protein